MSEEEIENGFKFADITNIPLITSEMILSFLKRIAADAETSSTEEEGNQEISNAFASGLNVETYKIDYVQLRRADLCYVKAIAFCLQGDVELRYRVAIVLDEKKHVILETACEDCDDKIGICKHANSFMFWLHRRGIDSGNRDAYRFWGCETNNYNTFQMKDVFACDEIRTQADLAANEVTDEESELFAKVLLDEVESANLVDIPLYIHLRPQTDSFESLYIHHAMLDNANNNIRDLKSFNVHMDEVAKLGLFDKLCEMSISNFRKTMWNEAQYCRIRCSTIHDVVSRKYPKEDPKILDKIFLTNRDLDIEVRCSLKEHKRFILKQTEKLENKEYKECGLLLNESYPYICASPDGLTDDHVVEIKAPRNDEEFEKYLEGKETIAPKYMAQIQLQMYMANVSKALYCVLSPTFDTNGALHYVWVQADMEFVAGLLSAAEDYWKDIVFPKLLEIYVDSQ